MHITLLYAGVLALILVVLAVRVLQARAQTKVNLGDGGNELLIRRMRGQANFVEYVPMSLVCIGILEFEGARPWLVHALGGTLVAARLLHGYTFAFAKFFPPGRFLGASLSLLVLIVSGVAAVWMGLRLF